VPPAADEYTKKSLHYLTAYAKATEDTELLKLLERSRSLTTSLNLKPSSRAEDTPWQ
jgi:hypothetical protein